MAITVDQASIGTIVKPAGGATTVALTTNAAVASGATIILTAYYWSTSGVISSVAGGGLTWTIDTQLHATGDPQAPSPSIIRAHAPSGLASGTTITVTYDHSADPRVLWGMSFNGIDSTTPVDNVFAATVSGSGGAAAWASASETVQAGSLLIGYCGTESSTTGSTPDANTTEAIDNSNGYGEGLTVGYRIAASTGAITVGGTWTSATQKWRTNAVAYMAAVDPTDHTPKGGSAGMYGDDLLVEAWF
jgi:hypothetical protein